MNSKQKIRSKFYSGFFILLGIGVYSINLIEVALNLPFLILQ